jgi:hypothetical protein
MNYDEVLSLLSRLISQDKTALYWDFHTQATFSRITALKITPRGLFLTRVDKKRKGGTAQNHFGYNPQDYQILMENLIVSDELGDMPFTKYFNLWMGKGF